jgi:hypothetical protein
VGGEKEERDGGEGGKREGGMPRTERIKRKQKGNVLTQIFIGFDTATERTIY